MFAGWPTGTCWNHWSIDFGVVQGSTLGPLLFIIYVNDIVNVSSVCKFVMYADDMNVFVDSTCLSSCVNLANNELGKICRWISDNTLTLNIDKCEYVIFHRKRRKLPPCNLQICIDGAPLERVESSKFLGLIIDKNVAWDVQVGSVVSKLSRYIHILYKIRRKLNLDTLRLLYN